MLLICCLIGRARGVVRAQETLSAAAYYQPLFAEAKRKADTALRPPMFVLDRRRLTPYTDDATQFDNRYVAKLPLTAAEMRALGADHVLYVLPARIGAGVELDDLNDELVVYASGGVDVKALHKLPDELSWDEGAFCDNVGIALCALERGQLKLDAKVCESLDLEEPKNGKFDPRWRQVTIQHLLQHTGGWDRAKSFDPMFHNGAICAALNVA